MKIDYKTRYQTIKDKGAELSLNISSYIDKKYFLSFRNSFYANFREIPLEDYLHLEKSNIDTGYFPILSRTFEGIEPIEEGEEYYSLGYKITRYLRQDDNYNFEDDSKLEEMTKESIISRAYLPLELSYLFNTHNEETIEDTLTRYIKAVFNTPRDESIIKEEISKDFNKYALVFSLVFSGGWLLHPTYKKPSKDDDFKERLKNLIDLEKKGIKALENEIITNRKRILESEEENISQTPHPFNSDNEELSNKFFKNVVATIKSLAKEENTPKECVRYEDITKQEIDKLEKTEESIISLTTTEDSYLRLNVIYLDIIISNLITIEAKKQYLSDLEYIYNKSEILQDYSYKYLFLVSGEIKRVVKSYNKVSEKVDIEITPHFVNTGEPTLEIVRGFQASTSEVNNEEELKKIEQYRNDYLLKDTLEGEINKLKAELSQEQQENGYTSVKAREIEEKIREKAQQISNLDLEKRGKSEYAPFNYFILDNRYRKVDNTSLISYQTTPTDSVIIVNNHTRLFASNSTIASFNPLTTNVLVFLLANMVKANDKTFSLSNEEIEKFILKENYENATIKERNNARNQTFISALDILSKTTIQTLYAPSKTSQKKGYTPRKRGSGSLISFTNSYTDTRITFNENIYSIAFKDFPIIPLSPNVYNLKPRAFITTYYLHNLFAFNKNPTFSISIKHLIENNISYSGYLKNLKKNPERLFKPILEDFEEMKSNDIISSYSPSLTDYMYSRAKLKVDDFITLTMVMKPQKKKGK